MGTPPRLALPFLLAAAAACASSSTTMDAGGDRAAVDLPDVSPDLADDLPPDAPPLDAAPDVVEEDVVEEELIEDVEVDVPERVPAEGAVDRSLFVMPEVTVARAPSRTGPTLLAWGRVGDLFPRTSSFYPTPELDVNQGEYMYSFGDRFGCETQRRSPGGVRCWGRNELGQLGRGGLTRAEPISRRGWLLTNVRQTAAGAAIACALGDRTYCWGFPRGTTEPELSMVHEVESPALVTLWGSPTADHLCGTDADGGVFCHGVNQAGETGQVSTALRWTPSFRRVANLRGVVSMAMAEGVTMAVRRDGTLWCWGRCTLPVGTTAEGPAHLPRRVDGLPLVTQVTTATQPSVFTCVRTLDGTVQCWGHCESNNLGLRCEPGPFEAPPRRVPVVEDVAEVYTAGDHTCARAGDGRIWCWGGNEARAVHPSLAQTVVFEPTAFNPAMP